MVFQITPSVILTGMTSSPKGEELERCSMSCVINSDSLKSRLHFSSNLASPKLREGTVGGDVHPLASGWKRGGKKTKTSITIFHLKLYHFRQLGN